MKDVGEVVRKSMYDDALLERALRESSKAIPPLRPPGYGITVSEFASAKPCSAASALRWLKENNWRGESMRFPAPTGKIVAGQVFVPPDK